MTPEDRSRRARIAALTKAAHTDGLEATAAAREAAEARFEREVDPEGVLEPEERRRRARVARKLYFQRLSAKGVAARRARASQ